MSNVAYLPVVAGVEITTDEHGRFNLNLLHRASGGEKRKGPGYWMALDGTKALIEELTKDNTEIPVLSMSRGRLGGTFVHELLAISYAGWISPAFQLKVNQVFMDYRTGKLEPVKLPVDNLSRLDILKLALESEQERERLESENRLLEHKIEEDQPKVVFHDSVTIAPDCISVAQAAKILGTGQRRLFAFLREVGWITRRNEPYQAKIETGLMNVKLGSFQHPSHGLSQSVTPLVTGKGLAQLQKLMREWAVRREA